MIRSNKTADVIERCLGVAGEIQLQRRGKEYEIIYNGVFLIATYNGASEKAAVREALAKVTSCCVEPMHVLIGGLGVGYSLREALDCRQVARVTIAEIEPAIIKWNRDIFKGINKNSLDDPRAVIVNRDFREVLDKTAGAALRNPARRYHVIMVDTDNGSNWLSLPGNAFFYDPRGLQLIKDCLYPGGAACFWCHCKEEAFEERLKRKFPSVSFHKVLEKTGQEGCYYLAGKL